MNTCAHLKAKTIILKTRLHAEFTINFSSDLEYFGKEIISSCVQYGYTSMGEAYLLVCSIDMREK